jgi:enoyl-[acyl-carrier protein] reductase/trans-2-enoyl-CoA reductase (NAD+)
MIIKPRVRGFMCITSHPTGCEANVRKQIDYVQSRGEIAGGPKRVLVIGASTGYGLSSRVTAAFGSGASTIGLFFEKPGTEKKPGTAGWYNSAAFHKCAEEAGLYAKSINGDAFSDEIKTKTIELIKQDLGQVDLVVYSLASPRRQHPKTGEVFNNILKPIDQTITYKSLNTDTEEVGSLTVEAATQEEIDSTVAVMGGEDWQWWIEALDDAGVLADGAKTTAYTYLGDKLTWDIYWHGTIGAAKKDLDKRVVNIRERLATRGGDARVSVLQAVVTQASSAIPAMPLYLALLIKVMRERDAFAGCIEQVDSLFRDSLYGDQPRRDEEGRLRADDWELQPEIQELVTGLWNQATTENLNEISDFAGYKRGFLQLFGFEVDGVDYEAEVDPLLPIKGVV